MPVGPDLEKGNEISRFKGSEINICYRLTDRSTYVFTVLKFCRSGFIL